MNDHKVALITGGSSGIGEATARCFAANGFRVAMAARRLDRLENVKQEIEAAGGEALAVQADVTSQEEIRTMVGETLSAWNQVDVLVNNAGFGRFGWLEELDPDRDIRAQIDVNLTGTILAAREVLPHMIERRSGHIINMASMAGYVATPTYTVYAASKYGLRGFTEALRREVRVWGVRVSAVFPGGVDSPEFAEKAGVQKRKTKITTPQWLRLSLDDVAQAVFRVSQRSSGMVVLPWLMRFSILSNRLFPGVLDRTIEKRFVRPERGLD
ncbi:MAG TPA: SDR family oxidoreductase [Anaerolineales bacterium]|nr:SDR family oxidoreductase [Anaerolineales bacterium]